MTLFLLIFLSALAESLVSFVGGFFVFFNEYKIRRLAHFVVSFATGALLGVSFLELIPEAIHKSSLESVMPFVLGGMVLFFIFEKFLFWYHCHGGECPVNTYTYLVLWGDLMHNFIDGIIIALTFLADTKLGIITTIAVLFHEIPQEIGDFGVLIHGGMTAKRALLLNFLVSLSTMLGAIIAYSFGAMLEQYIPVALALIAGNFIYLAATDLMPELHETAKTSHSIIQVILIILGAILVIAPEFIFG